MTAHVLEWVTAQPLWKAAGHGGEALRRPALLRFTTDDFMEELLRLLEEDPTLLEDREARDAPLKIYQPVHGHFHLVAAELVCQQPGLPDHAIERDREEQVGFVLRRLTSDTKTELCLVADAGEEAKESGGLSWRAVGEAQARETAAGEEIVPLFPVPFTDASGHRRMIWAGLIPASRRETFDAAKLQSPAPALEVKDTYAVRCVYRRPRCRPSERVLVSDRSAEFAIARYFDPDAPARPVRITLPVSLNGLQKSNKKVKFVLPMQLRDKLSWLKEDKEETVGKVKDLLAGNAPSGGGITIGAICSLSIPVITLCAYIVLMIFLTLFNLIFKWILWPIVICLPIPKPQDEPKD